MRYRLYTSLHNSHNKNSELTLIRFLYIAPTITSSTESNHLHVKQIETIQAYPVAQVPPRAIRLRHQQMKVYSPLDHPYSDERSGSDTGKRLTILGSIGQWLHRMLISLLNDYHASSLMYRHCCKCLVQVEKPLNSRFSILDDEMTLQWSRNVSSSWLHVAIWTHPHPEKHCIIPWWLMVSPPCGPSETNQMNCLLFTLERLHWNCYWVVPNVFCIVERTAILIVIDIVCEVGKSLETQSNVIL